jgi:sugar/nucleoside kinase (ribokinase family)
VAIDDLLYVAAYPAPDSKVQIRRRERHCGGLTATALVAAARLGSRCAFAGVLGGDDLSQFVRERFRQEGVSVEHLRQRNEARPIHSVIVVDLAQKTRTILYDLEGAFGAEPDWPAEEVIRASRVLFVDHFGIEGMTRAARIARGAGIPVVADLESDEQPGFDALSDLVDHLVLSESFACKRTGAASGAEAAAKLWAAGRRAVVVTCGRDGAWFVGPEHPATPRHQPAFPVEVVDTTGCGDVFHGAYASALARGLDLAARVRFAAAAAALKATQCGGQAGIPTLEAVEKYLQRAP